MSQIRKTSMLRRPHRNESAKNEALRVKAFGEDVLIWKWKNKNSMWQKLYPLEDSDQNT